MFFWQLFPTLYFCPFFFWWFQNIEKYFWQHSSLHYFFAWFSFCPVGYFTYLCIPDPFCVFFFFYSIYTFNPRYLSASTRGTPEHDLHRSQRRNQKSKLQRKGKVRGYITSCDEHYKSTREKSFFFFLNMARHVRSEIRCENKFLSRIPSHES